MPEYDISGVSVNFPFEPYDVQRRYMEKVIECLDKGTNGVLESPTGLYDLQLCEGHALIQLRICSRYRQNAEPTLFSLGLGIKAETRGPGEYRGATAENGKVQQGKWHWHEIVTTPKAISGLSDWFAEHSRQQWRCNER